EESAEATPEETQEEVPAETPEEIPGMETPEEPAEATPEETQEETPAERPAETEPEEVPAMETPEEPAEATPEETQEEVPAETTEEAEPEEVPVIETPEEPVEATPEETQEEVPAETTEGAEPEEPEEKIEEVPEEQTIQEKVSELMDTVEREQEELLRSPTQQILTGNLFDALARLELERGADLGFGLPDEDPILLAPDLSDQLTWDEMEEPYGTAEPGEGSPEEETPEEIPAEEEPEDVTAEPAEAPAESDPDPDLSMPAEGETAPDEGLNITAVSENGPDSGSGAAAGPEEDLGFDFDAVTDALTIDAFEKEEYRYTENNLLEGGKNLLMGDSVTSRYYVSAGGQKYPAFRDLSMLCPEGSTTAIVSKVPFCGYALLRAVARPAELQEGKFILDGREIDSADLLYLGSDKLADPAQTVIGWLEANGGAESETEKMLEEIGIADWADKRLGSLTPSRRMLVILLGAVRHSANLILVNDPKFTVTPEDEMTARRIFLQLNRAGKAVIIAGSDPFTLQAVASRVLVLKEGQTRFAGTFREFMEQFSTTGIRIPETFAEQTGEAALADGRFETENKGDEILVLLKKGESGSLRDALMLAENAGVPLEEIRSVEKTFADAWKEAVR
ncbi:MAG: hypothetical protein IKI35_04230, partial [Stomatobaculum sp.]|nr:hypothetical protein [Stomatobaculum sp.]